MSWTGFATLLKVVGNSLDAKPAEGRSSIKVVAQNLGAGLRTGAKGGEKGGREGPRHKKRRRTWEEEWSVAA